MKMKCQVARVIDPNGEERKVYPLNRKKFTLEELQGMVGGNIEHALLPRGNGHATMWIDEEGKLKGRAYNAKASEIYGRLPEDCIVGVAVIVTTEEVNACA